MIEPGQIIFMVMAIIALAALADGHSVGFGRKCSAARTRPSRRSSRKCLINVAPRRGSASVVIAKLANSWLMKAHAGPPKNGGMCWPRTRASLKSCGNARTI